MVAMHVINKNDRHACQQKNFATHVKKQYDLLPCQLQNDRHACMYCTVLYKHKIGVTQVKKQMAATQVTKKITFIGRVGGYCGVSPPDCYICKTTGRFLGSNPPLPCNAVP